MKLPAHDFQKKAEVKGRVISPGTRDLNLLGHHLSATVSLKREPRGRREISGKGEQTF